MAKYTITIDTLKYQMNPPFNFGMMDYPVVSEDYREKLNELFFSRYRFHEIGYETPEMFRHFLNYKMELIMPRYNKLIEAELLIDNPLSDYDVNVVDNKTVNVDTNQVATIDETVDTNGSATIDETQTNISEVKNDSTITSVGESDASTTTTNEGNKVSSQENFLVESDTAQGLLVGDVVGSDGYGSKTVKESNVNTDDDNTTNLVVNESDSVDTSITDSDTSSDSTNVIDNDATNQSHTITDNDSVTDTTQETIESETRNETGRHKSQSELYLEYSESLQHINTMILDELEYLFMGIL